MVSEISTAFSKYKLTDKDNLQLLDSINDSFNSLDIDAFETRLRSTYTKIKSANVAIYNNPLTEEKESELQNILKMYVEYKVKYLLRSYSNNNDIYTRSEKVIENDETMIKSIIYLNYRSKVELEKRKCNKCLLNIDDIPFKSLSVTKKTPVKVEKIKEVVEICTCPAITLKGTVCGAKLKKDNAFCLRHLKK